MKHELTEEQRQATVLALAFLSVARPGWLDMLGRIAESLQAREMFDRFRELRSDTTSAVELIALERNRQVESEGYDAAHDDQHTDGSRPCFES